MYMITKNSDELYHYGVLGMRWGVRRYQNYDGTRIGTGGQPVVNRAKTAEGTVKKLKSTMDKGFRNTVPGGQGGKATGNARFAATAGGNNSSNKNEDKKSTAELILEPSVKKGKDKANTSVAQETAKGLIRTGKATQDSIKVIKNSDPKVKKAQEDNATKARKMSDQELRESINRIKMEREYVSLKNDEITTGYDKAIDIIDKARPFLEVTAEVAGLIASILLIKSKLGHSDSDTEMDRLYTYCIENNFSSDVIEHATSLDLDYILDYYNVSAEDLQHMLQDEDELYHYGVLGMKWGVRRYQNYDGTRIGAGSGSGGGGGRSKSPSSFRGSIATGQGGKAVGNARFAAKAFKENDLDTFKKDVIKNANSYDTEVLNKAKKEVDSLADELTSDYINTYKSMLSDKKQQDKMQKEMDSYLKKEFGDDYKKIIDPWDVEEAANNVIDNNIPQNVLDKTQKLRDSAEIMGNESKKIADQVASRYKDVKLRDTSDIGTKQTGHIAKGESIAKQIVQDSHNISWESYVSRHFDDYWVNDVDERYKLVETLSDDYMKKNPV